ncbi:hypothetical protein [Zavarzinia compransoris]|uniref:hypothetical protein n=1 Tax=Zavarzinia compransoris TaxID=1264899 RepID=UPI0010EEE09C|nr:hypothetical protein [Zavarzinia compransoris]TDP46332.1 hypothetical protein DES42_104418 [Zavarzinia compransoris]
MTARLTLRRGSLYLPAPVYDRYFAGLSAVVLLRRADGLMVLPVRFSGGGGYLVKQVNGAGDRVVAAGDFFRDQGLDDGTDRSFEAVWDSADMALRIDGAFAGVDSVPQT